MPRSVERRILNIAVGGVGWYTAMSVTPACVKSAETGKSPAEGDPSGSYTAPGKTEIAVYRSLTGSG